ncbi:MAG: hypothetical protein GY765_16070 [bacterium]|nr:hypothetical protein [bacterium]
MNDELLMEADAPKGRKAGKYPGRAGNKSKADKGKEATGKMNKEAFPATGKQYESTIHSGGKKTLCEVINAIVKVTEMLFTNNKQHSNQMVQNF